MFETTLKEYGEKLQEKAREEALEEGLEKGLEQGLKSIELEKESIVLKSSTMGLSVKNISTLTGFSESKIRRLIKKNK